MVEPHSSNFRVITTKFLGVRIFRKFTVFFANNKIYTYNKKTFKKNIKFCMCFQKCLSILSAFSQHRILRIPLDAELKKKKKKELDYNYMFYEKDYLSDQRKYC